jgi:hypothetical protein
VSRLAVSILGVAVLALGAHAAYLQFVRLPNEHPTKAVTNEVSKESGLTVKVDLVAQSTPIVAISPQGKTRISAAQAEERRKWQEHMDVVEAKFRAESNDTTWSTAALAKVRAVLASKKVFVGKVQSVECRSRTCRIEIADDVAFQVRTEMRNLILEWKDVFSSMETNLIEGTDGHMVHVLYVTRNSP